MPCTCGIQPLANGSTGEVFLAGHVDHRPLSFLASFVRLVCMWCRQDAFKELQEIIGKDPHMDCCHRPLSADIEVQTGVLHQAMFRMKQHLRMPDCCTRAEDGNHYCLTQGGYQGVHGHFWLR
jgi:hypothetical protein